MDIKNADIRRSYEAVNSLFEGLKAMQEEYKKGERELLDGYTGVKLADKMRELKEAQQAQEATLREKYEPAAYSGIDTAEANVSAAAVEPIPEHIAGTLASMAGIPLGQAEKEALLQQASSNYLASIKARDVLGIRSPSDLPNLTGTLDLLHDLRGIVTNAMQGRLGEFALAMLLHGDYFQIVSEAVSAFLEAFGQKGEGTQA